MRNYSAVQQLISEISKPENADLKSALIGHQGSLRYFHHPNMDDEDGREAFENRKLEGITTTLTQEQTQRWWKLWNVVEPYSSGSFYIYHLARLRGELLDERRLANF